MKVAQLSKVNLAALIVCAFILTSHLTAQSRDQNFPTSITANEIVGTIKSRDIGDSRLTSYYYVFDGVQGDIFVNVTTKNFSGNIDVFIQDGLQPLTKMVIYADAISGETGRLVYLRKPERLILRVEGRTPNDDQATFRVKFGGSFVALAREKGDSAPVIDRNENESLQATVNSVGTRIEPIPKRQPPVEVRKLPAALKAKVEINVDEASASQKARKPEEKSRVEKKTVVIVGSLPPATVFGKPKGAKSTARATVPAEKLPAARLAETPNPLSNIRLVVLLKDGSVIEHPMNAVQKFTVEKGMLIVIAKGGTVSRHSILDVSKVTIE